MKNKILLAITLASCNFATQSIEISAASSAKEISHATIVAATAYIDLIEGVDAFLKGTSDDRAPLLKLVAILEELFPAGKKLAKQKAKTDAVHEKIFEYENDVEPSLNKFLTILKTAVSNNTMTHDQLRNMLNSYIALIPQMLPGLLKK